MALQTADTPADPPYWTANPSKPKLKLPPGACDAHVHIFGPRKRFPFAEGRNYTPSDATKEMLFALHERLGIEHCVIVQPNCHGRDNSVTVDAVAATGQCLSRHRAGGARRQRRRAQAAGGCRAVRRALPLYGASRARPLDRRRDGASPSGLPMSAGICRSTWTARASRELSPALKRSPVPVVIDHIGRVDAALGLEQPGFRALLALMENKHVWVKVSGTDRITRQGPPYADAVPFARKLVAEFGDRCVWGTDWPHPNHAPPVVDDGLLVDILAEIAPSEAARQALLVDNPQRLYRFAPARKLTGTNS